MLNCTEDCRYFYFIYFLKDVPINTRENFMLKGNSLYFKTMVSLINTKINKIKYINKRCECPEDPTFGSGQTNKQTNKQTKKETKKQRKKERKKERKSALWNDSSKNLFSQKIFSKYHQALCLLKTWVVESLFGKYFFGAVNSAQTFFLFFFVYYLIFIKCFLYLI